MTQIARPEADIISSGFTDAASGTTSLYASIDEESTPDGADYVQSGLGPDQAVYVCRLSAMSDPVSSADHVVRYAYQKGGTGGRIDLTIQLREGYQHEGIRGALVAEWTHRSIPATVTEQLQTLTADEADLITNYADLYLRFVFDQP